MISIGSEKRLMIHLNDSNKIDVNLIGTKAANLGILLQNNINVPDGFVISTNAYDLYLKYNRLDEIIQQALGEMEDEDIESIKLCSNKIKNAFFEAKLPNEVISEIQSQSMLINNFPMAIRSSASAEDLPKASFAGQYDSYLNVYGENDVLDYIKKCYSSLWTTRAISYRIRNHIPHLNLEVAVIIQRLIPAKSAGILFTTNPINPKPPQIIIESNFGLGESIASGKISPDQFIISKESKTKSSFKIIDKRIGNKKISIHPHSSTEHSGVEVLDLPIHLNEKASLTDSQIFKLSRIGIQIEKIFGGIPQDIEWAIDKDDNIYILQTRPITSKISSEDNELLNLIRSNFFRMKTYTS